MTAPPSDDAKLRVDKWLWHARFFKSRARAGEVAGGGALRINGTRCTKPAQTVRPGDVLTFAQGNRIRVIRVEALGERRGPAPEAETLYADLDPPPPAAEARSTDPAEPVGRDPGEGRPTKRDRREIDRLRRFDP
ncbi:MAG: RNA-binding S4 domain-containing protein [Paracoccaceae bacterium]